MRYVGAGLRPALATVYSVIPSLQNSDLFLGKPVQLVKQRVHPPSDGLELAAGCVRLSVGTSLSYSSRP
jgi:hypothetical protein